MDHLLDCYFLEFAYGCVAKALRNTAVSIVDPGTVATDISLTPSAVLSYLGQVATDDTDKLSYGLLGPI